MPPTLPFSDSYPARKAAVALSKAPLNRVAFKGLWNRTKVGALQIFFFFKKKILHAAN